jgi:hypothetical protein
VNHVTDFLTIVGLIDAAVIVAGLVYATYLWASGIAPVLLRLGNGLAKRKIAIFAKGDDLTSLRCLLADSKLFPSKNLLEVTGERDVEAAKDASLYLVFWPDWHANIEKILARKPPNCALLVYQPYDQGRIADEQMKRLDGERHTAVTNFRGRLLNDIVTSVITTRYAA